MAANDETEILSKLGTGESMCKDQTAAVYALEEGSTWFADTTSDDEDSDSTIVFQRLLDNDQQKAEVKKKTKKWSTDSNFLLTPFIVLGITASVVGITLPNIAVNAGASSFFFLLELLSFIACGHFMGVIVTHYISWICEPSVHIMVTMIGTTVTTMMIGFTFSPNTSFIYSVLSGFCSGSLEQAGLMSIYSCKCSKRPAYAAFAVFALGAALMSTTSSQFFSGLATPYARHLDRYSSNMSMLRHLLSKRDLSFDWDKETINDPSLSEELILSNNTDYNISINRIGFSNLTTTKRTRPDHVVGVVLDGEPKSLENKLKRKKAEEHLNASIGSSSRNTSTQLPSLTRSVTQTLSTQKKQSMERQSTTMSIRDVQSTSSVTEQPKDDGQSLSQYNETLLTTVPTMQQSSFTTVTSVMFSDLNWDWKRGSRADRLLNFVQQVGKMESLNNVEIVYLVAAAMCLLIFFLYVFGRLCCRNEMAVVHPEAVEQDFGMEIHDEGIGKLWRFYSFVFFALIGGTENLIGNALMIYSIVTPELGFSQRDSSFVVASYWLGIFISRLIATVSGRTMPVSRLNLFLLGMASLSAYIAFSLLSLWTFACAVFALGSMVSLQTPSVLCWLHEQEATNYTSLIRSYGLSISIGRLVQPWIAATVIHLYSSPSLLFFFITVSTVLSFIALLFTVKMINMQCRLRAIYRLADANIDNVGTVIDQKNARKGKYIALLDDPEVKDNFIEH